MTALVGQRRGLGDWVRRQVRRSVQGPATGRRPALYGPAVVVLLAALLPVLTRSSFQLSRYELVLTYMMVAIGLNFGFGYGGQLAIAQPVVMGVAAYTAGLLNVNRHWNSWATLVPALVVGSLVNVLVSLPGFRLRGWYLAITTFFAVAVFPDLLSATQNLTHGDDGLGPIDKFRWVGDNPSHEYWFVLALTGICWLAVWRLVYSRWGIMARSLRDSPNAAQASGVNMPGLKVALSVISALPVALAGWVFAHSTELISPTSFNFALLLLVVAAVMLGGRGTVWGPIIGTLIFEILSLYIGPFSTYNSVILGFGVFICATVFPIGIIPVVREAIRGLLARGEGKETALAEPPPEEVAVPVEPFAAGDGGEPVLRARGIAKAFGGRVVLRGVDLDLSGGLVYGLVGPNGSGKTTLLNVLTGFVSRDAGEIQLCGTILHADPTHQIARRGIRRSFQVPQLVAELSVGENIKLGAIAGKGARRHRADLDQRVAAVASELGMGGREVDTPGAELSLGLRRIVEIGRAMIAEPDVICLDEPAAGLAESDLVMLARTLRHVASRGCAVLLIEHNLSFVQGVADEIIVLEEGEVTTRRELAVVGGHRTFAEAPDQPPVAAQPSAEGAAP
jgi:branched-chain amino acid transport system permease protein